MTDDLDALLGEPASAAWGSPVERERKRRIDIAVWAYAYEFLERSVVDDATFDRVAREIDLSIDTGNVRLDAWFRAHFDPSTGLWVHQHPERARLARLARLAQQRGIMQPDEDLDALVG